MPTRKKPTAPALDAPSADPAPPVADSDSAIAAAPAVPTAPPAKPPRRTPAVAPPAPEPPPVAAPAAPAADPDLPAFLRDRTARRAAPPPVRILGTEEATPAALPDDVAPPAAAPA